MKKLYAALLFAILAITGYAQNSWTGLAGPSGGKVSDIQNDGTKIFALAPDLKAIYKSTDDGATWTQCSPVGVSISAMLVDATQHKLYAIESNNSNISYMNVSSNDGLTWQRQNSTSALQAVKFLRLSTGELVAWGVSTNEGLSISFDNGITWTKFYTDAAYNTIFNVASNSVGDVFLTTGLGVFRHPHAAQGSWLVSNFVNIRPAPVANSSTIRIGVDKSNDRLYVMEYYWNGTANVTNVYGSSNNGTNWIDIKSDLPAGDMYYSEWFISANGVFLGVGNYNQKIYKANTTLGGSWTEFTTSPGVAYSNSLVTAFTFISTKIFAGTTLDGIFKSTNNGSTWSIATKGINGFDGKDIEVTSTGRILYLATSGLGFWYSDDQGANWNFKQISTSDASTEIVVVGTTLLAYGSNALYKSIDNGSTWTGPVYGNYLGFVARGGTNELYATIYNVVSKSIDMGDTWTPLSITGLPSNFTFMNDASSQYTVLFNQTIAIDGTGKLYLSLKNTDTNKFELYSVSSTGGTATKLPVEYSADYQQNAKPNNLFAVGNKVYWSNNNGIFISIDNGATWITRTFSNVKVMPVSSGIGASRYGVFFTSGDDGLTWNSYTIPNSAANAFVRSVATNTTNDAAFAATSLAPALKYVKPAPPYVNPLIADPSTLPPYVSFNWTPFGGTSAGPAGGPYGGYIMKTFKGTKNPSKFFVLANYNLYSTPNMATPWTKVVDLNNNNISITDIAVDANGDFLAVGGGGFLKSTDEGQHWTGTWSVFNYSQSIRITSTGILWVNDGTDVRRSVDGGLTWSIIYSGAGHEGYNNNSIAASGNTIFVVETGVGISRSTNANVTVPTFTTVNNGLSNPTLAGYSVAVDPSGNAIAWYNSNIYRLTVGSDTWVPINGDLPLNTYFTYTFCKTDQEYYIFGPAGTNSGVYRTINAGANWTKMNAGLQIPSAFFEGGEIYATANYEGFYHSADNGTTWTEWSAGIKEQNPSSILMINNQRLFITSGGNIPSYVSLDKGTSWSRTTPTFTKIFPLPDGSYLASSYSATGNSGMVKSTDGGATWSTFTTGVVMTDVSTADGNTFYGVSYNSIYTKTSSSSWTQLTVTGLPASYGPLKTIAVDSDNKAYIILTNYNNNFKPELYQIAFGSAYKMDFTNNPVSIQFHKGKTYAFDGGGTLYSTVDGVTWTSKPTPSGTKFSIGHLDYFFILDNGGAAWLSRDLGSSWQNVGETMGYNQKFADVFFNPNDGVVYGAVQNDYQRKSAIILPAETQKPTITQYSPISPVSPSPVPEFDLLTPITLQITFDETVNPVATKKIKILDYNNGNLPILLGTMDVTLGTQNGNTFTFNPSAFTPAVTFAYSKTYFISIDPGAFEDVNAVPNTFAGLLSSSTWQIKTKDNDGLAPVLTIRSPADNAIDVAYNSTLQLTFDENIYAGTGKTIRLYESPSTLVQSFASTQGVITGGKTVTFTPTNPLGNGKSYYVLMDAGAFTDMFGNNSAALSNTTDWNFNTLYVDTQAPVIATFSPANNATGVSFTPTLQLTFNEDIQTVAAKTLRIYDSGAPSTPIETINALSGVITGGKTVSYTLSTVLSGSKTYYVLIDAGAIKDLAGNSYPGISSSTVWKFNTIIVDTQAPVLTQLAPANNATNVAIGTTLSLTFDEDIKVITGKKVKLFDNADPATPIEDLDVSSGTVTAKSVTFTLAKSLVGSKTYYVLLDNGAITDMVGNAYTGISTNTAWKFSTDAIAPTITQLTPLNNSIDVAFTTTLALGFSETVVAVGGKTVNLFIANTTTPVAILDASAGIISGNTVTFTLTNPLVSSTSYYVLVTSGAFTDVSGNPYAGITAATDWTFTTRDGSPPAITLLEPTDDATEIALTSKLKITFDEDVTKVVGKKLVVYESSQPTIALKTIDISTSTLTGKTLSFDPGNIFAYNKSYFVLLETGAVTDASGNQFGGITSVTQWQFSVETDTQKPTITHTDGGAFTKGASSYLIATSITDNKVVSDGKVFYRGISSENAGAFTSASLTFNTSTSKYEFSIPESAFDKYGIEFYIEASDVAGNVSRSPADANTLYYTYVKFSAASAPPLSGIAFGGTLESYRIIAVPYNLADNKVATIFGELGSADKKKWRLLTYQSDAKWNDYPTDFTTIDRGVGYWINIKTPTEIFIEGASTEGTNKSTLFTKTFNPGWNQIGNPYPVAISWNAIKSAIPAASSLGVIKTYKDGFQNGDILQPLEGGFVFNSGAPVTISIPLPASSGGRQASIVQTQLDKPNWTLDINMKQGNIKYELAGVGMNPQAQLEFDSFDDLNPPHFSDFAEIQFSHPHERISKFSRDIVPTQNSFVWEFTVDSNLPDEAELYWDNSGFGNNNKELYLYDVVLQKPIDMRRDNIYRFDSKKSLRFKIFYGEELEREVKPEHVTLGTAYPNPAISQTTIPFTLSENGSAYRVSLEIFDSMGKKVGTLMQGDFSSGFYNAVWDLSGGQTAQGIYHIRLEATSDSGVEIRSGKIVIQR